MRMARIAALLLCLPLGGCQILPEKGASYRVYEAPAAAYPLCPADAHLRYSYRKRVAFAQLQTRQYSRLRGLHGIESRYMATLAQRLDRGRYQPLDLSVASPSQTPALDLHGRSMSQAEKITTLAQQHRAQFVVTGEILDMAQQQPRSYLSRVYRETPLLGLYTEDPERMVVIRLDVFDGSSGQPIDQQVFTAWSRDGADLARQHTLMGERFMHTPLGQALDGLLEQQSAYIAGLLSCIPLQFEVQRMAGLEQAVLSAGAAQGLRPGDVFRVTRERRPEGLYRQPVGQRPVGELVVEEVYPEHAVGRLASGEGASLRQGDWVRAW